jgi:hypothetical protein
VEPEVYKEFLVIVRIVRRTKDIRGKVGETEEDGQDRKENGMNMQTDTGLTDLRRSR